MFWFGKLYALINQTTDYDMNNLHGVYESIKYAYTNTRFDKIIKWSQHITDTQQQRVLSIQC